MLLLTIALPSPKAQDYRREGKKKNKFSQNLKLPQLDKVLREPNGPEITKVAGMKPTNTRHKDKFWTGSNQEFEQIKTTVPKLLLPKQQPKKKNFKIGQKFTQLKKIQENSNQIRQEEGTPSLQ